MEIAEGPEQRVYQATGMGQGAIVIVTGYLRQPRTFSNAISKRLKTEFLITQYSADYPICSARSQVSTTRLDMFRRAHREPRGEGVLQTHKYTSHKRSDLWEMSI